MLSQKSFVDAEYWFRMCYEFNAMIPDCGVFLIHLYLFHGQLDDAVKIVKELIQLEKSNKIGVHHYKIWDCDLPRAVFMTYSYSHRFAAKLTSSVAKFMLLMVRSRNTSLV